jgi:hypothetical protein
LDKGPPEEKTEGVRGGKSSGGIRGKPGGSSRAVFSAPGGLNFKYRIGGGGKMVSSRNKRLMNMDF